MAPMRALMGSRKKVAPRKAKMKPESEPSRFLALLKGYFVLPHVLPSIEANPSPNVSMAIEACAMFCGKIICESIMPKA